MEEYNLHLQKIVPVDIEGEMKKSFISYAMATIISRALPDVRDGLKPVHRRILYSMHELGLTPDKPYKKSVRIVGDVLGKYHPHGDTAVYDAMVRMAQDFSIRCPLVDGHGNFGSVDGDSAAAMRYTEARMSRIALELLRDIEKDTVDFVPNFDESAQEPSVLPSRFPNLLVNGSGGIAVGMATNIPPHNLTEVINGTIALIENPDLSTDELMEYIPGPDFPTGATIMGRAGIQQAYRTGRGKVIMRAKTEIEDMDRGRSRIVVTEIPYQVNKANLVEKIADLIKEKRLEGISDLREESDRSGMRVVIELKTDVNPSIVLNYLYKHTQMQETFGVNMLALVNGEPRTLSLKHVLLHYIDHQKEIVTRRTRYDLEKAQERAHIVEGLLKALDVIDEIIALIRASANASEARTGLMERFDLSEKQAQAILDMRLQRLTGLERIRLEEEYAALKGQIEYFLSILNDEQVLTGIICTELRAIADKYGDPRRTEILASAADIDWEDVIQREEMAVTVTHNGYIKRIASSEYRTQNRGGVGIQAMATREEDFVERLLVTSTHDWLLFFTNKGRVFKLRCFFIPEAGRHARGTNLINLINLDPGERVQTVIPLAELADREDNGQFLLLATRRGIVKKTPLFEYSNLRNVGLKAINLSEDDELIGAQLTDGEQEVVLATHNAMSIRFHEKDIRPMHRVSSGVMGIRLKKGDWAVDLDLVDEGKTLLAITEKGYGKRTAFSAYRQQSRNGMGMRTFALSEKTGKLVALKVVAADEDLMLISSDGTIIRTLVENVPTIGRATQGVRVMRLRGEDTVVSVAVVERDDEAVHENEVELEDLKEVTELPDTEEDEPDTEPALAEDAPGTEPDEKE
jgi:DNA gyrase subunit A